MPKASELKKGSVVEIDGEVFIARQIDKRNPSARGASTLFKVRFFNVRSGQKLEQTLKGDDFVKDGDLVRRSVQFSYREGDITTFMDTEDYSQYSLNAEVLEEQVGLYDRRPGRYDRAAGRWTDCRRRTARKPWNLKSLKPPLDSRPPAPLPVPSRQLLSTGLEVQVPEYLESWRTHQGEYCQREICFACLIPIEEPRSLSGLADRSESKVN